MSIFFCLVVFFVIWGEGGKWEKVCETGVASSQVFFAVGAA